MSRLPRLRGLLGAAAPLVVGIVAGSVAVTNAIAQEWMVAIWAAVAAAWAFLVASRSCPAPPAAAPVERGLQCLHFDGGPVDGGQYLVPFAERDLHGAVVQVEATDYRVIDVDHTCFRAELAPVEEGQS